MSRISVSSHVIQAIKKHAASFPNMEIYGWLLGYEADEILHIISSVPCKSYNIQNRLVAEPSTEEVFEISKVIPKGISIVGIYHSHVGSVFHSATDDQTIKQFSADFQNFLSIVSNPKITKFYQICDGEIIEVNNVSSIKSKLFKVDVLSEVDLHLNMPENSSIQLVSSQIREIASNVTISYVNFNQKKLDMNTKLKNLNEATLHVGLKIPTEYETIFENDIHLVSISLNLKLHGTIFLPHNLLLADIKDIIINTLLDDVFHQLRTARITANKVEIKPRMQYEQDDLPWTFYPDFDDEKERSDFIELMKFRLNFMSFQDKKKKEKVMKRLNNIP